MIDQNVINLMGAFFGLPRCHRKHNEYAGFRCKGCGRALCLEHADSHSCRGLAWASCNCEMCQQGGRELVIVNAATGEIVWNPPAPNPEGEKRDDD